MSLLEFFFIISGFIILILWIDVARRQKFNALHFLVFISIGSGLLVFTFFPHVLTSVWNLFWLQRGADLLVYSSIIFLIYFSLLLLRKSDDSSFDTTRLIREMALNNSEKRKVTGDIVFVIPAYNEWAVIYTTVEALLRKGYTNIIVVNDGSKDNTESEILRLDNSVIYLKHFINRGQGAAIETGFEYVRRYADVLYVVTFDSDGQHDIADLEKFIKKLESDESIEIVLGSRFIEKTHTNVSFSRKLLLKAAILFTFFLSSIHLTDAHNWYRVMRKSALDTIRITLDGMGHSSEIVDIISTKMMKYAEVPVNIKYTDYSKSKGQKSSNAINIALEFIWNKFFK